MIDRALEEHEVEVSGGYVAFPFTQEGGQEVRVWEPVAVFEAALGDEQEEEAEYGGGLYRRVEELDAVC